MEQVSSALLSFEVDVLPKVCGKKPSCFKVVFRFKVSLACGTGIVETAICCVHLLLYMLLPHHGFDKEFSGPRSQVPNKLCYVHSTPNVPLFIWIIWSFFTLHMISAGIHFLKYYTSSHHHQITHSSSCHSIPHSLTLSFSRRRC